MDLSYLVKVDWSQMLRHGDRSKGQDTSDKWILELLSRVRVYVARCRITLTETTSGNDNLSVHF